MFGNEYSNPLQYAHNLYINNTLVTEITIPDTVTEIKGYAFWGWNGISITIPDSVTSIGICSFSYCSSLTSVTIGNSVTRIGGWAFSRCSSLTNITITDSVTSIGEAAFTGCDKLVEVYNKSSLNITKGSSDYGYVGYYAKNVCTKEDERKLSNDENGYILYTDGDDISLIGYTGTDTELILPSGITEIYQLAFYGNSTITSIIIPDSVTIIEAGAFYGCSSLTSITIPDTVTRIYDYAFYNCSSLTSITFEGTKAQWNAISKDSGWDEDAGEYTIHCTDGDIAK